jgi:hypothetical protein
MARPTDKQLFLRALKDCGGRSPNPQLQANLGWGEDKYWRLHQELFDAGEIERGRGRGGMVLLVAHGVPGLSSEDAAKSNEDGTTSSFTEAPASVAERKAELALYEPVKKELQRHWALRRQLDECHCEITAMQGRRDTGGSWSRPDLCVIGSRKFEYFPERVFELHTFEVKPSDDVTIKGVLEALAHRESATRSYVLFFTDGADFDSYPESSRIQELAGRHGIGVIAAAEVDNIDSWEELVPATRALADPELVNTFIGRSLSDKAQRKIRRWFTW